MDREATLSHSGRHKSDETLDQLFYVPARYKIPRATRFITRNIKTEQINCLPGKIENKIYPES